MPELEFNFVSEEREELEEEKYEKNLEPPIARAILYEVELQQE
jgi:hypothetical protein